MTSKNIMNKKEFFEILNEIPFGVLIMAADQTIYFANKMILNLSGDYSLMGKKCSDSICMDSACKCPLKDACLNEISKQKFYTTDGLIIPVLKTVQQVKLNHTLYYLEIIVDISEQVNQENELRRKTEELKEIIQQSAIAEHREIKESEKFELLFETGNDALYLHDLNGNFLKVNQIACEHLGYSKQEFAAMNIRDIDSPNYATMKAESLKKLNKGEQISFEMIHVTRTGNQIPVEIISRMIDFDGDIVILSRVRDITIRKMHEELLLDAKRIAEENEAELKIFFDKASSTILHFDQDSRIIRINQKGILKFKVDEKKVLHERIGNVIYCTSTVNGTAKCGFNSACKKCQLASIIDQTISNGKEFTKAEVTLIIKIDEVTEEKTVLISTSSLMKNGKKVFLATIDDITSRKKMEKDLISAKEKAEESERLKSAFLDNISHEIRTPLTGILGFINFFEEELSIEQKTEYMKIINKSSDRLLNTINDIIEISRLNSEISIKKIETFDFRKSLNAFLNDNNLRYGNLEIIFSLVIDSKLDDLWIQTDHSKVFIIIKNLLDNAYKFTNKGSINLTIKIQKNSLLVIVKDTGIGIAPAYHEQIFEAFRQVDSNLSKAYQGKGLGLTIARKYVNYLGGKIGLESELGKGATFYFVLPEVVNSKMTKTEKKSTNIVHKEKELIGKTILIAEDENTNFLYLKAVLSKSDYTLVHAVNGYEAVEICKSTDKLDLVIMDLKMPVMDGIEASRKIKEMRKNLPIIAHSAYALNDEKQEALTAGCIDYLPKPAKPNQLLEMISKYISGNNNNNNQPSNSEFKVNSYFH